MSYSLDFRRRVLDYKEKHKLTFEETATHFDISIRSLFRWSKKIEPCTTRNKQPTKINTQALLEHFIEDTHFSTSSKLPLSKLIGSKPSFILAHKYCFAMILSSAKHNLNLVNLNSGYLHQRI